MTYCNKSVAIFWTIICSIVVVILIITTIGVIGYLNTEKDTCDVLQCINTEVFYKEKYITIANVTARLYKTFNDTGKTINITDTYYDVRSKCDKIKNTTECFYYTTTNNISPVMVSQPLWLLFLGTLIPVIFLGTVVYFVIFGCCLTKSKIKKISAVFGMVWIVATVFLTIIAIIGVFHNTRDMCLKTNCSLQNTTKNGKDVNVTQITIKTTQFDRFSNIVQPTFTYTDFSKYDCGLVNLKIQCYYHESTGKVFNNMMPNFIMVTLFLVPIVGIGFLLFGVIPEK